MVDYSQPLTEYDVTVTMARQPHQDGPREERRFIFTIPAVDAEAASDAYQLGLGINDASGHQWKLADDEDGPHVRPALPRPTITVLCGSTRFGNMFAEHNLRLTVAGHIVLSIGCDTKADADLDLAAQAGDGRTLDQIKTDLDELHKRKIDLADEVLVLNVNGYIGESTRSEIEYAETLGKPIRYLEEEVAE